MRIGLAVAQLHDNRPERQLQQVEDFLKKYGNRADLLVFGEAYLQGFHGLSWSYEKDRKRAVSRDSKIMIRLQDLCRTYGCGVSLGMILREGESLYSGNVVIDSEGRSVDVFHRVSPGWRITETEEHYREGRDFHCFSYEGVKMGVMICGDGWYEENLEEWKRLAPDLLLWPLYVDYGAEEWKEGAEKEYARQVKDLPCPVLFVNGLDVKKGEKGAHGGAFVFRNGETIRGWEMDRPGTLLLTWDAKENIVS